MKSYDLKNYLRRNKDKQNGCLGSFTLRLLFNADKERKPVRVEIGLGTSNEEEALQRAAIFLKGVYALGGSFSNKISVSSIQSAAVPLVEALKVDKSRKAEPIKELPLFCFSTHILPPKQNLENGSTDS